MGCGSDPSRWRRCLPAMFLLAVTKQLREQLKRRKDLSGVTVWGCCPSLAGEAWWQKQGGDHRALIQWELQAAPFTQFRVQAPVSRWWVLPAFRMHLSLFKDPCRQTCPEVYFLGHSRPRQLKTNYHQEENTLWIQISFLHGPSTCIQSSHMIFLKLFVWYIKKIRWNIPKLYSVTG